MKKITTKDMAENSNIPENLIRAVVRQSGGMEAFAEDATDITNHGIDGGFHGWIYYADTCKFWERNRKEILEYAEFQAEEFGQGMLEMITGFGVFQNDPLTVDEVARAIYQGKGAQVDTVQNVMAWFAAEEVARLYTDLVEE